MEAGTCCNLRETCFGDLKYLWSIIRHSYFQFFPKVAFTEFRPERNESEKISWMLQTLAKQGWTPLPVAEEDTEKIYEEPDLRKMLCILKNEADPHYKFPKMFTMLPFTEFPEGQPRYSLPNEKNIPCVVHYICIDLDKASEMEIKKFERVVVDATRDGWNIYRDNLRSEPSERSRSPPKDG